jgi:hypothetical protein
MYKLTVEERTLYIEEATLKTKSPLCLTKSPVWRFGSRHMLKIEFSNIVLKREARPINTVKPQQKDKTKHDVKINNNNHDF